MKIWSTANIRFFSKPTTTIWSNDEIIDNTRVNAINLNNSSVQSPKILIYLWFYWHFSSIYGEHVRQENTKDWIYPLFCVAFWSTDINFWHVFIKIRFDYEIVSQIYFPVNYADPGNGFQVMNQIYFHLKLVDVLNTFCLSYFA